MSEDIYTKFGIYKSRLKRDYQKEPIKITKNGRGSEYLSKEELEYLFIELNLSVYQIKNIIKVSNHRCIERWLLKNNIKKSPQLWTLKTKQTNLEKYGIPSTTLVPSIRQKQIDTCLKKYGVQYYLQSIDYKQYMNYLKNNSNYYELKALKTKQTNLEKYGVPSTTLVPSIRQKQIDTCLKKYGVNFFVQSQQYKDLYKNKEFIKNKNIKQYETMKNNKKFLWNSSKPEKEILNKLLNLFPLTIYQYTSDLYPFNCDFYIPEIDTYIEYQGFWTHGKEPYIGTDEQKEKVKLWETKNTPQYKKAIKEWTHRDVLKRETAIKNNINYLEFFNMNQFNDWFNAQKNKWLRGGTHLTILNFNINER